MIREEVVYRWCWCCADDGGGVKMVVVVYIWWCCTVDGNVQLEVLYS